MASNSAEHRRRSLNPSDDYIADYLKDVIEREFLIRSNGGQTDNGPRLDLTTPLEDAMGRISVSETSGYVVDDKGHVIGK